MDTEEKLSEMAAERMRERISELTQIIEAVEHIANSSYWKVLERYVFEADISKAKRRLAKENDTTEIFRLQGELRFGEKFSLEKLLTQYRNELEKIKFKLNHG